MEKKKADEEIYIIPFNYTDNGKVLGFIEPKMLLIAVLWAFPLTYFEFKFLPIADFSKFMIFFIVILPPAILVIVGVGHENIFDFIRYVYNWYKNARIYTYEK